MDAPDGTLRSRGSCVTSFLMKIVLVSVQDRCMICAICSIDLQIILDAPLVPLDDEAEVEACFGPLEKVLILTQDRCTVCVEHTIGWEIILDAPDGTPM